MGTPTKKKDFFKRLKWAAEYIDGDYGVWAYDTWKEYNRAYFDNALEVGGITWGLTRHGAALGYYAGYRNLIVLHSSLIEPRSESPWGIENLGYKFAADVLLHEMMHQNIHQHYSEDSKKPLPNRGCHTSKAWVSEVNRMAGMLNLDCKAMVIKQRRVKLEGEAKSKPRWIAPDGYLEQTELSSFPHSVRPENYYGSGVVFNTEKNTLQVNPSTCM
jgi:hypothetical protein